MTAEGARARRHRSIDRSARPLWFSYCFRSVRPTTIDTGGMDLGRRESQRNTSTDVRCDPTRAGSRHQLLGNFAPAVMAWNEANTSGVATPTACQRLAPRDGPSDEPGLQTAGARGQPTDTLPLTGVPPNVTRHVSPSHVPKPRDAKIGPCPPSTSSYETVKKKSSALAPGDPLSVPTASYGTVSETVTRSRP